ncbi:MAG: anti-sigma factor antagonist, partial [Lachnospiraceae bacterium]|nr:anti-sigma factor antagonist [Lachnospiraceae bacterium]
MNEVIIFLSGRIDSLNATQVQQDILDQLEGKEIEALMLDLSDLSYISSAGLRMVLHIRKEYPTLSLVNVSLEVYETLEITGFTQIMPVQRAYRTLCVEGCEIIGEGANGIIYRIDRDHVVKLIKTGDLEEIQRTRETSQLAFVLGIPTAIPYDIVRIGDGYGAVFELLDAQPFSVILAKEPEKTSWCVREYTDVL